jgi:hypothetical protein
MIRVELPYHLRNLARVGSEVQIDVSEPITQRSVLDALEDRYPMLRGTIRDHVTLQRRASRTCRTRLPTRRCPILSRAAKNRSWLSARLLEGRRRRRA